MKNIISKKIGLITLVVSFGLFGCSGILDANVDNAAMQQDEQSTEKEFENFIAPDILKSTNGSTDPEPILPPFPDEDE